MAVAVEDTGGVFGEGRLVLPGLGSSDPGVGDDFVETDFDEPCAGRADGVVVTAALFTGDDEFAGKVIAVRQSFDSTQVETAEDRRGPQCQRRGRAGGDQARLGAGQLGDPLPGGRLQLLQRNPLSSSLAERLEYRGGHRGTTQSGDSTRGIDDRGQAEVLVARHRLADSGCGVSKMG